MRLHLHGIGICAAGFDEPFLRGLNSLTEVPIRDYAKPSFFRRFGRVARLFFVAASRAMAEAGIDDPSKLALVSSTALGEATVSIELLSQINATRGKSLSPAHVTNSVHNAPAGYLSMNYKNREPALTVSEGWLSAEASLAAAEDLLATGAAEKVLVVSGDEVSPAWASHLAEVGAHSLADALNREEFQEGAFALILGPEPGGKKLGTILGGVEREMLDQRSLAAMLERHGAYPSALCEVRLRTGTGGDELLPIAVSALHLRREEIQLDGPGLGTAQAAGFAALSRRIASGEVEELLLLSREVDEYGFIHWAR